MHKDDTTGERRHFSRVPFNGNVTIAGARSRWSCNLIDISMKGVLTTRPESWNGKVDDGFQLHIHLGDNELVITMDADTAHIGEDCIGFRCTHIDLDSMTHLRRLLELNIGDEERINHELSALIFNMGIERNGR